MLGLSEDDDRRLRALERTYDPLTVRRLDFFGVRVDWRCLTAGAGGAAVARWLRQRVGPTGRVMTADLDPFAVDRLPEGPFDLIHARALLDGLPDPGRVTAALVRRLWPGGLLLVEESDAPALLAAASGPCREVWEHVVRLGPQGAPGPLLPTVLRSAGLVDVGAETTTPLFCGGSREAEFARLTWRAAQAHLVTAGLDPEVFAAAAAGLDDPERWFPNWPVMAAWGRRPTVVVSY